MIDFEVVEKDFRVFCERNAKMYGKTPEYIAQTPTAKEYYAYLIEREKDKIRSENKNGNE